MQQMTIGNFLSVPYKITKPIRLIELFAGVGSQAMALRDLGADFEPYRVVELDKYAIASYNAIHGTNFPTMDIKEITGGYLGVKDIDQYEYIMTYSFPCQDLSVAGLGKGMAKGSNTRSGLLWEVERLLNEVENLPQILMMENVPQVHGKRNAESFQMWLEFLQGKGYSNFWKDMNAKDYGVAQSRNRTIMVSILGEYTYEFAETRPLEKRMRDYLEDEVDEKFYLTSDKARQLIEKLVVDGKLPLPGGAKADSIGFLDADNQHQSNEIFNPNGVSRCLNAVDWKAPEKVIEVQKKNAE